MAIKEMIFDAPLYSKWSNEYLQKDEKGDNYKYYLIDDIKNYDERIEYYCPKCNKIRVFAPDKNISGGGVGTNSHYGRISRRTRLTKTYRCSQNIRHELSFGFLIDEEQLIKVSEYPSRFDLSKNLINKYEKVLSKEKVTEMGQAAQLESHGYSIAAFLHYRRIFEHLIFSTFKDVEIEEKLEEAKFRKLRMEEKIKYIEEHLPVYFNENSFVYAILSKGIHELNQEECNDYLPVVKTIIYYSLDEAIEKRDEEIRKAEYAKKLSEINSKLGK